MNEHDHDHEHPHAAGHAHPHATEQAPASADNLLLDIGAGTGALVIRAGADRDQAEVEISPADGSQGRSHNVVRPRSTMGGPVYAAVFPALPEGTYDVWRDQSAKAGTVTIHGGQVTSFRLD